MLHASQLRTFLISNETKPAPREFTPTELACLVKLNREGRSWSQEQLAEIAGVTTRTVQRVEASEPSGIDTRRALARAFGVEDIDCFNKPHSIPTDEEVRKATIQRERDYMTLDAHPLTTDRVVSQRMV